MSKETFKSFARSHPELASRVMKGDTTWQRLYELYDIYGENNNIWKEYFASPNSLSRQTTSPTTFKEFFNTFRNLDLDSVQKGVANLQKTIGLLQEIGLGAGKTTTPTTNTYEPRPMYKYFED